jgi:hypothetical protein
MIRTPAPIAGHEAPRGPTSEQLRARALAAYAHATAQHPALPARALAPQSPTWPGWWRP